MPGGGVNMCAGLAAYDHDPGADSRVRVAGGGAPREELSPAVQPGDRSNVACDWNPASPGPTWEWRAALAPGSGVICADHFRLGGGNPGCADLVAGARGTVAGSIAQERERRTLDSLLTTRLSSAQIVVSKLLGGLVQYAACLLTTLPIMILLSLLGGIDPRLVMLAHAGTASLAFFVAGLSMLISTSERRAARALNQTIAVATAWCILPAILQAVVPRLSPLVWYWIRPPITWWAASSPNGVAESVLRFGLGSRFFMDFDHVDDRAAACRRGGIDRPVDRAAAAVFSQAGRGRRRQEHVFAPLGGAPRAIFPEADMR